VLVPFGVVSLAFSAVLYTINDRRLGRIQPDRIWAALRELPAAVLALLGLLLVAQIAVDGWHLLYPGVESDVGLLGHLAQVAAWNSLVTCALAVGVQQQQRRATAGTLRPLDARSVGQGRWVYRGVFVAVSVAVALSLFSSGEPIFDESEVHTDLASRYADAAWVSHLKAANTYHANFEVFLDTDDMVTIDRACQSLSGYAKEFGHAARLFVVHHGVGVFLRTC
jgi:hypothetical protein